MSVPLGVEWSNLDDEAAGFTVWVEEPSARWWTAIVTKKIANWKEVDTIDLGTHEGGFSGRVLVPTSEHADVLEVGGSIQLRVQLYGVNLSGSDVLERRLPPIWVQGGTVAPPQGIVPVTEEQREMLGRGGMNRPLGVSDEEVWSVMSRYFNVPVEVAADEMSIEIADTTTMNYTDED